MKKIVLLILFSSLTVSTLTNAMDPPVKKIDSSTILSKHPLEGTLTNTSEISLDLIDAKGLYISDNIVVFYGPNEFMGYDIKQNTVLYRQDRPKLLHSEISSDRKIIAIRDYKTLTLYDTTTGKFIREIAIKSNHYNYQYYLSSFHFHPQDKLLFLVYQDCIYTYNYENGEETKLVTIEVKETIPDTFSYNPKTRVFTFNEQLDISALSIQPIAPHNICFIVRDGFYTPLLHIQNFTEPLSVKNLLPKKYLCGCMYDPYDSYNSSIIIKNGGNYIATRLDSQLAHTTQLEDKRLTLGPDGEGEIVAHAFHPKGFTFATVFQYCSNRIEGDTYIVLNFWDLKSGIQINSYNIRIPRHPLFERRAGYFNIVTNLSFSPNGKQGMISLGPYKKAVFFQVPPELWLEGQS